jgi:hypothetical protein
VSRSFRALTIVAVLSSCSVASPVAAQGAARHGQRVAAGPLVQRTSAQLERSSGARSTPHPVLPLRRGRSRKESGPAAPSVTPSRAQLPRTAFTSPLNFLGPTLADAGAFPPDTQGAVGPSQFLVTINGRFRSYDKATGVADGALNADPDVFFDSVLSTPPAGGFIFTSDPHVRYDRLSQRWFIVMIDVPLDSGGSTTQANRLLVASSDGPILTPSTVWTMFAVTAPASKFADYPTLGVDANALYVGVNNFLLSGAFDSTDGYVIGKASVLGSGLPVVHRFTLLATPSSAGPFTPQGADNPDPGATQGYFIGVDALNFDQLDLVRVSDPGGASPTVSGTIAVSVPSTSLPITVPHLGNTGGTNGNLDALDDRLFAASIRNNHLWTAHNIGVTSTGVASSSPTRDASRWYELNLGPATPTVVQTGTVFDSAASNPLSYWIPTVAVSGQGHMAIGGSVAGAAHRADAWFSGRLAGDTLGATDAPTQYTATSAAYNPASDPGGSFGRRWGDYSAVSLDPSDDMTMWTIQEYASSTNTWGTRIARLRAPAPATPTTASQVELGSASTPLVVTGDTTGGTGFFDPGPGFTRPQATVGCGITVSAVSVQNPGQATLTLDTTAATGASPCTIAFTNPDGQTRSASVPLTYGQAPVTPPPAANRAPVVVDDAFTTPQGTALQGPSLLANDSDPDGNPLTATKATDPSHGTVTVAPDGAFVYTPVSGYSGPDAFTYAAGDGAATSVGTASIMVTPSLQPPTATKLTLTLKKLKGGKRRVRASGKGPAGARVKLVVRRGKKKVATRTVSVSKGRWTTVFKLKRSGRYTVVATTGRQKATARKRL